MYPFVLNSKLKIITSSNTSISAQSHFMLVCASLCRLDLLSLWYVDLSVCPLLYLQCLDFLDVFTITVCPCS